MLENNPFTLSFGKEPKEYIKRVSVINEIINDFEKENSTSNIYVISGVRGSGKTVLLSTLYKYFDKSQDFIAADLNTRSNMLEDLAAIITDKTPLKFKSIKAELSFSFLGTTITFKGKQQVSSISQLLENQLNVLKKHHKKLVVTIDDVDTEDQMKLFAKEFQSLFRKDLPIYLIVTGLFSTIDTLERQEGLTFLQRSQKRYLSPLNIRYIAASYKAIFNVSEEESIKLAELTKGYAFAYQTLGYLLYESNDYKISEKLLRDYDYYLEEYVYRRVYNDIPEKEKAILKAIAIHGYSTNKQLVDNHIISNQEIYRYKEKLSKRGICDISTRGEIKIVLPRFTEFIKYNFD